MNKYNKLIFACMSIDKNVNKAMHYAGLISQKILKYEAIPFVPYLSCFGNNQDKKQYEELWKSMVEKSDVVFVFNEIDKEMQKQIDYAKAMKKKIYHEVI